MEPTIRNVVPLAIDISILAFCWFAGTDPARLAFALLGHTISYLMG